MGRKGNSGMGSSGGSSGSKAVQDVFGKSANEVAKNYWNNLKVDPTEKYAQAREAADGKALKYHQRDAIRTQAGDNNPDLTNGKKGRDMTWKQGYNETLRGRLGESGQKALQSAIQSEAQQWLNSNPRPEHPRKDGYKWDGTKYTKG